MHCALAAHHSCPIRSGARAGNERLPALHRSLCGSDVALSMFETAGSMLGEMRFMISFELIHLTWFTQQVSISQKGFRMNSDSRSPP